MLHIFVGLHYFMEPTIEHKQQKQDENFETARPLVSPAFRDGGFWIAAEYRTSFGAA